MRKYLSILLGILLLTANSCKTTSPTTSKSILPEKKSAEWYYEQGVAETKNANPYVAINNFTKAIKKKPDYYSAYMERASAYLSVDSVDGAIRDYDSLLNIKSLNQEKIAQLYYLKGSALYLNSADSSACFHWRKAKDLGHNDSWNKIRKFCK